MKDLQTTNIFINRYSNSTFFSIDIEKMKLQKYNKWFTLIEMLWVLAIVVILLSISIISFRHGQAKARDVVRKTDLQMIADALISYNNDHGHFPSSIYDNVSNGKALTISAALNKIADWWIYFSPEITKTIFYLPTRDSLPYMDSWFFSRINDDWDAVGDWNDSSSYNVLNLTEFDKVKMDRTRKDLYDSVMSIIDNAEKETPITTSSTSNNMNYAIVTQWMCVNSLKKYLVNEWYISTIPQDPSWEKINLQTNICFVWDVSQQWFTANDSWWSIQGQCKANTNFWCTQICKEWYVYISDWEHFALIAHMESENGWNYETTACGSCEVAWQCEHTDGKSARTKTDQLPCDITDEFTNTFDCIQNTGVVEYATWQYYFYIY